MSTRRLGRAVVAVGVWAAMAGAGGCGGEMTPFTPGEGDFTVRLPAPPKVELSSSTTPQGPQRMRDYSARGGKSVYSVTVVERLDGQGILIEWDSPEAALDDLANRLVKVGGRVLEERPLSLDGNPGREYKTDANEDGWRSDFRFFAVGPRMYMLCYEVPETSYSEAKGKAFFDSFALGGGGSGGPGPRPSGSSTAPPPPPIVARSSPAPGVSRDEAAIEVERMAGLPGGMSPAAAASAAASSSEAIGRLPGGPDAAIADRGAPVRGGVPPAFGGGPPGFGPGGGVPGGPVPGPGPGSGAPGGPAGGAGPGPPIGASRDAAGAGFETEMAGGTGGGAFRQVEPGRPLLGIDFGLGAWDGEQSLARVKAIFARDQRAAPASTREIAPEGYAVGGAEVRTIRFVNAIRFTYMRLGPDGRLDPDDRIQGDWVGHPNDRGRLVSLGGDGRMAIGIVCKQGAILDGLALVMDRESR